MAKLRNEPQAIRSGAVAFAEFLAYSGLRLGEAREVCRYSVNFDLNSLLVTGGENGTKNHEARTIPLFPALRKLLERILHEPTDTRLFPFKDIRQALGSACCRAGLLNFVHHALRHFLCSNAIEAGIDFEAIEGWLRHKDGEVLVAKAYGHLLAEHSAAMVKRMTFDATKADILR